MNHNNYKEYSIQQLYEALETVDEINYPGQLEAIENRINEIEGNSSRNGTNSLEGIGGWLILVAIGVIISPIQLAFSLSSFPELFSLEEWGSIIALDGNVISPYLGIVIIIEILVPCTLLFAWLYMGYRFFTKHSNFPRWYIGISIFTLFFTIADAIALNQLIPDQPIFDSETIKETARALFVVLVWVPYMLVSKRVKATFVN